MSERVFPMSRAVSTSKNNPCPTCGGTRIIGVREDKPRWDSGRFILCPNCAPPVNAMLRAILADHERRASEEAPGEPAADGRASGSAEPAAAGEHATPPGVSSDALTWCPIHGVGVPVRAGRCQVLDTMDGDDEGDEEECRCIATGPGADAAVRALEDAKGTVPVEVYDLYRAGMAREVRFLKAMVGEALDRAEAAGRERDLAQAAAGSLHQRVGDDGRRLHELRAELERLHRTIQQLRDRCGLESHDED